MSFQQTPASPDVLKHVLSKHDSIKSPIKAPYGHEDSRTSSSSAAPSDEGTFVGKQRIASPDSVVSLPNIAQNDTDDSGIFQDSLNRTVHFADDMGMDLVKVHAFEKPIAALSRLIILLLSPEQRTFEFLHAEYPLDETTTVQVLLEQLPLLATNKVFAPLEFCKLSRTKNNEELDTDALLSECQLEESELVLGVLKNYSIPQIATFAVPLLVNGKITKAVSFQLLLLEW